MCGIWGIITHGKSCDRKSMEKIIEKLFLLSEVRGKDAAGIAVMSQRELNVFKRPQTAEIMLKDKKYHAFIEKNHSGGRIREGIAVIGHSRMVTNGTSGRADNNQPISRENMITVHNGIIVNADKLWKAHPELKRMYEVDTEIFVELCERYRLEMDTQEAVCKIYKDISGMASTLNLFADTGRVIAATNNGSLYYCISRDQFFIVFASERMILEKLIKKEATLNQHFAIESIKQMYPMEAIEVDPFKGKMRKFSLKEENGEKLEEKKENIRKIILDKGVDQANKKMVSFDMAKYKKFDIDVEPIQKIKRCSRCVLPATMPFIEFDEEGICNYCRTYKRQSYLGKNALIEWGDSIRKQKGVTDSIVSFSGGRDSSFGLHYFVKELGLHPVAFSYDWGMVTDLARRNQSRMCSELGIELILVSADLKKKRENIRKNVLAWLKKPDLGMVPLFMAGDKQYFYYANQVCKNFKLNTVLMASNPFEKTHFKSGFCGSKPSVLIQKGEKLELEQLAASSIIRMAGHYAAQYILNPRYINSSLLDTIGATASYYMIPHNYFRLFNYIPWNEKEVNQVLLEKYDWEISPESDSTWRIGDGTSPFYNYIYYLIAGFTENDTLRSNQIREGMLTREEALRLVVKDNAPRFASMKWYFDVIGLDMGEALSVIQKIPKLY